MKIQVNLIREIGCGWTFFIRTERRNIWITWTEQLQEIYYIEYVAGFLKPDSGITLLDNINTGTNAREAREIIGYIPENVNLYSYLTGIENLYYFCQLAGKKIQHCGAFKYSFGLYCR